MTILAISYIYVLLFLIWYFNPHRGQEHEITVLDIGTKPSGLTIQEWIDVVRGHKMILLETPYLDYEELSVIIEDEIEENE